MSNKAKVLKKHPDARCVKAASRFYVRRTIQVSTECIGAGKTEAAAWAAAARNLR